MQRVLSVALVSLILLSIATIMAPKVEGQTNFLGLWRNIDPNTQSIPQAQIWQEGSRFIISVWGACVPQWCDWGNATLSFDGPTVAHAVYNPGFAVETLTIELISANLQITSFTHFTDNSGRADYTVTDLFQKVILPATVTSEGPPPPPPQTVTTVIITTAPPPQTATAVQPTVSAPPPGPDLTPIALSVLAVCAIIGLAIYALSIHRRTQVSVAEVGPAGTFEVSVNVPSMGKTVALEVAPDHTVGSLVESVTSALDLPKGRAYAVEYAGRLISQPDFGKSLAAFGMKQESNLTLRVVE